jgi:hypothetical protein
VYLKTGYKGEFNFGPKREEEMDGLRKLHNEELHNSYPSLYACIMMTRSKSIGQVLERSMSDKLMQNICENA